MKFDAIKKPVVKKIYKVRLLPVLLALSLFGAPDSRGQDCPSQVAARLGYKEFSAFYNLLAPLWNEAYPAKNYEALVAAGPPLDSAMAAIYEMKYSSRYDRKFEGYKERRHDLLSVVSEFSRAAEKNDSDAVYQIFPRIQAAFESTAVYLLPLPYPSFDKALTKVTQFVSALPSISDSLLLANATDTITAMIRRILPADAPGELKARDRTGLVATELAYFDTISVRMRSALEKHETDKFKLLARELATRFLNFHRIYLE